MEIISENEWIDENLKRIIKAGSNNVDYMNRLGSSANYEGEREYVIETLERLELAKCDNFGGVLMRLGETIRDKHDGSYLKYMGWVDKQEEIEKRRVRRWKLWGEIKWHVMALIGFLAVVSPFVIKRCGRDCQEDKQKGTTQLLSPKGTKPIEEEIQDANHADSVYTHQDSTKTDSLN